MTALNDVLYTARATSTGGRTGESHSDDGALQVTLSTPKALGGAGGNGTNPEQLFAAGYSACFIGALQLVASQQNVTLPAGTNIGAIQCGARAAGTKHRVVSCRQMVEHRTLRVALPV